MYLKYTKWDWSCCWHIFSKPSDRPVSSEWCSVSPLWIAESNFSFIIWSLTCYHGMAAGWDSVETNYHSVIGNNKLKISDTQFSVFMSVGGAGGWPIRVIRYHCYVMDRVQLDHDCLQFISHTIVRRWARQGDGTWVVPNYTLHTMHFIITSTS